MAPSKTIFVIIKISVVIFICCCGCDTVILPGDISGYVIDAETSEPVDSASVELNQANNTIKTDTTGSDGLYRISNIEPGNYEIQASKTAYTKDIKNVNVVSANTTAIDFSLSKTPYPEISDTLLDFGLDATIISFTISNIGAGKLTYTLSKSHDWMTMDPTSGDATTETDTITVIINRTGLPDNKHVAEISILSDVGENFQEDKVQVFVNGVLDKDGNYYGTVTIGTQMWMAENLNTGERLYSTSTERLIITDNEVVEKLCYENIPDNCKIYGGMYFWDEMMDYYPGDSGTIGTTQGICPAGWHIPTYKEWITLIEYLGGEEVAGGKLKAEETIEDGTGLWLAPNEGATNESGFTALPGGDLIWTFYIGEWIDEYAFLGEMGVFWTATYWDVDKVNAWIVGLGNRVTDVDIHGYGIDYYAASVRCIKDP